LSYFFGINQPNDGAEIELKNQETLLFMPSVRNDLKRSTIEISLSANMIEMFGFEKTFPVPNTKRCKPNQKSTNGCN